MWKAAALKNEKGQREQPAAALVYAFGHRVVGLQFVLLFALFLRFIFGFSALGFVKVLDGFLVVFCFVALSWETVVNVRQKDASNTCLMLC